MGCAPLIIWPPDFAVITGVYHSAVTAVIGQREKGVTTCHNMLHVSFPFSAVWLKTTTCIEYLQLCTRLGIPQRTLIYSQVQQSIWCPFAVVWDWFYSGPWWWSSCTPQWSFCESWGVRQNISYYCFTSSSRLIGFLVPIWVSPELKLIQIEYRTKRQYEYIQSQWRMAEF